MSIQADNQKKIAEIEAIHVEYIEEIRKLHNQQNELISEFIKKIEEKKMDSLRALINNSQ